MGLHRKSCCIYPASDLMDRCRQASAPDPHRFKILFVCQLGDHLVCEVEYPGCTNFEGRKIMVFENMTELELRTKTTLDPHFAENGDSPIARFPPTERGGLLAIAFATLLNEQAMMKNIE